MRTTFAVLPALGLFAANAMAQVPKTISELPAKLIQDGAKWTQFYQQIISATPPKS